MLYTRVPAHLRLWGLWFLGVEEKILELQSFGGLRRVGGWVGERKSKVEGCGCLRLGGDGKVLED